MAERFWEVSGDSENAKRDLGALVIQIHNFFGQLFDERGLSDVFSPDLIEPMLQAWVSMPAHFEQALFSLDGIEPSALIYHGLTGEQLRFKASVLNLRFSRYSEVSVAFRHEGSQARVDNEIRAKRRWLLRRFFGALDAILDSVTSIAPGVGAVAEFKAFVEQAVKDADE